MKNLQFTHEQIEVLKTSFEIALRTVYSQREALNKISVCSNISDASNSLWKLYCELDDLNASINSGNLDV